MDPHMVMVTVPMDIIEVDLGREAQDKLMDTRDTIRDPNQHPSSPLIPLHT